MPKIFENKKFRLFWVVLVGVSCFVLGYTIKPKSSSRAAMLKNLRMPNANGAPSRMMPPLQRPYPTRRQR